MKPFNNGSEYRAWRAKNCAKCIKDYDWKKLPGSGINIKCRAETHLAMAYVSNGEIHEEDAKYIGLKEGWDCPHRESK